MQIMKIDIESMRLRNFSRFLFLAINNNKIQTGNLIMESLPERTPNCNLHVFPNFSAAPALKFIQLHFNYFKEIPAFALKNLSRLRKFAC